MSTDGFYVRLTLCVPYDSEPWTVAWEAEAMNSDNVGVEHGRGPDQVVALIDLVEKLTAECEERAWHLPEDYVDLAAR